MPDEIRLEWTYTPADFFEERAELLIGRSGFVIDAGTVMGRAPFEGAPAAAGVLWSFCNTLHQSLDSLFLAAQILAHKAYSLSAPRNTVRLSADGARHFFVLAEPLTLKISGGGVNVRIADAAGNAIVDSRRDRIARRKDLGQKAAVHIADPAANSILRSYSAAVIDPRNELVHLYEILETLWRRLGGKKKARATLGISEDDWDALGTIACDKPLLQGRHRGRFPGTLVPATDEQLSQARAIAVKMIEAYLAHLEQKGAPS